jgi:hypothetical protein
MLNFQVLPQGGATRRPGGMLAALVANQASRPRLITFLVSNLTAYVLELGVGTIRFYYNRGLVLDSSGAPLVLSTPYAADELRDVRYAQSADVMFLAHGNHAPLQLSRTSINTFTLAPVVFRNGPFDTENTGDVGAIGSTPTSTAASAAPATPPPTAATENSYDPTTDAGGTG